MSGSVDAERLPLLKSIKDMAKSGASAVVGMESQQIGSVRLAFAAGSHVTQAGSVGLSREQKLVLSRYALEPGF